MPFCGKCGTQLSDSAKFCPSCGTPLAEASPNIGQQQPQQNLTEKIKKLNDTEDTTALFDEQDIEKNRIMALFAYLGILVLIPLFGAKDSKFARFHANQGLVLMIAELAYGIIKSVITLILKAVFPMNWEYGFPVGRGFLYTAITGLISLLSIVFLVLAIVGIVNAVNGKAKELPIIGSIKILK